MTMFVDRRKDNYDELLVLAHDSRVSRARTNRWTTGLIVTAMAGSAAYVATMDQQVDQLKDMAKEAEQGRDTAELAYERILDERNVMMVEMQALERYRELYAKVVPIQDLSNSITVLAARLGPGIEPTSVTKFALSNIVWMVDGSRRFPMINGDILWIPEGNFWVELVGQTVADHKLYLYEKDPLGAAPVGAATVGKTELTLPYRQIVKIGSSNCIDITLHKKSLRPVFRDAGYVDIEITYFNSDKTDPCSNPPPPAEPRP